MGGQHGVCPRLPRLIWIGCDGMEWDGMGWKCSGRVLESKAASLQKLAAPHLHSKALPSRIWMPTAEATAGYRVTQAGRNMRLAELARVLFV